MRWNEQEPETKPASICSVLRGLGALDAIGLLSHIRSSPVVAIESHCQDGIVEHLRSQDTELGGLLIGRAYVPSPDLPETWRPIVHISEFLQSQSFRTSPVSLAMGTEIWDRARESVSRRGKMVVGWYHSHPNLGAFFSGTDRRTQRSFFNRPYSVGLVIDPIRNEDAWFIGPDATQLSSSVLRGVVWPDRGTEWPIESARPEVP